MIGKVKGRSKVICTYPVKMELVYIIDHFFLVMLVLL